VNCRSSSFVCRNVNAWNSLPAEAREVFLSWMSKVRGAIGAEDRGAVGAEGSGVWGDPPPQKFFLILHHEMAFSGAFWVLYFTVQVPAVHT